MSRRPMLPQWTDMKPLGGLQWALLAMLGLIVALVPFVAQRLRKMEDIANAPLKPAPIDGDRAYRYLKEICAIGPRPAGSQANTRQRELVAKHFKEHGAEVREQPFVGQDPRSGARVEMANLIGSWHPDRTRRVLLGVHYDTRPFPDEDPDPAKRTAPFIGANDGASGVAMLMEIAHHLNDLPTDIGVDLVLFDGEELVYGGGPIQNGEYFLGSKEFARVYSTRKTRNRYIAALVLDMIGDRDLGIDQEEYSVNMHFGLVREVWSVAKGLNATAFKNRVGTAVRDDHLPLMNAGIPAIDIIDFDYPQWHTASDLPEYCSGASLQEVGRVVTAWLALPKARGR